MISEVYKLLLLINHMTFWMMRIISLCGKSSEIIEERSFFLQKAFVESK